MRNFLALFLLAQTISFSQFDNIKSFQKKLIQEEKTGSNVAMVYKDGNMIKNWKFSYYQ